MLRLEGAGIDPDRFPIEPDGVIKPALGMFTDGFGHEGGGGDGVAGGWGLRALVVVAADGGGSGFGT